MRILNRIFKTKSWRFEEDRKVQVLNLDVDLKQTCLIQINWSDGLFEHPLKLHDCSFDHMMYGLDLYALGLKNGFCPDKSSLLYYNSKNRNEHGKITNAEESIICYQGIDIHEKADDEYQQPYDGVFFVDLEKIDQVYDKIIFFIGRPLTNSQNSRKWIDKKRVTKVSNEKVFVNCFIDDKPIMQNVCFCYNQVGAITLVELDRTPEGWKVNANLKKFEDGLNELIQKYLSRTH